MMVPENGESCEQVQYLIPVSVIVVCALMFILGFGEDKTDIFKILGFYSNLTTLAGMGIALVSLLCIRKQQYAWYLTYGIIIGWVAFLYYAYKWRGNRFQQNMLKIKESVVKNKLAEEETLLGAGPSND